MTRKILLDGNPNDRPSLPFAIFLCLIPLTTFFYMKRRQRNRYNRVPSSTGRPARDAESERKEQDKKKREDKVEAEKKKIDEAKEIAAKAQQRAAALEQERRDRYMRDLAKHPNDPFLDDQTPDEVFNRVKPLNPNPTPPSKPAVRNSPLTGQDPGNPLHKKKSVDFTKSKNEYEHPVTGMFTLRKDGGPSISEHDPLLFVPKDQNPDAWDLHARNKITKTGRHLNNDRYRGLDHLQGKTDELKKLLPEATSAIFQKAANIAYAQKGSADYEEAMVDNCDDDHGTYPHFASVPIAAIVGLLTENDVSTIVQGMLVMKEKVKRGDKTPYGLASRYCLREALNKETMTFLWFLDSFRVVSSLHRMNMIQGEPVHLEKTLGLKFILLEWLEIFGIQCAQQRLLSPAGFDLAGLCIRLYCLPLVKEPNELKLIVTIFLPGGPNIVNKQGEEIDDWVSRMGLAVASWREVWGFLSMQTEADGRDWGHGAFKRRELWFSPGFTFEGIKQAGGLPKNASPDSEPNNRHAPILNAWTPPKYPYPGQALISYGHQLTPMIRPTCINFVRRRQFTWAHTSLTKTSHDFEDGMVALCLEMVNPKHWVLEAVIRHPGEVTDDNLGVRLQNDDIKTIKFNSTIPMTMGKKNKPIGFPDVTIHPQLEKIYMTYVSITRHTDGTPSAEAPIPATATLVLASDLGLWTLLHRKDVPDKAKKVKLYVDIKSGDVQKFADELLETLIGLGKKRLGAGWSGDKAAISKDAKEDRDVLRQVYCKLENGSKFPISQKISKIKW